MTSAIVPFPRFIPHGTVTAELQHLAMFASKAESRDSCLTYVMVRKQGAGWQACATDGHRLALVDLPADSIVSDADQFYIPANMLRKVRLKRDETAAFSVDGDTVRIVCSSGVTLTGPAFNHTYPDIDQVVLDATDTYTSVWGINPDYVWEAGDYARKVTGEKRIGIVIHAPVDAKSPMRVTCGALPGYVCVIMPMHI